MLPTALEPSLPFAITLLCYVASGALLLILFLLILINSKLSALSAKLSQTNHSAGIGADEDADETPGYVEVHAGTHFEEFLNEDPERRLLPKKEQFKAYRAWRTEKGLNWSK
jgi:hypothetical protein